jgi:hypothetical protein
MPKRSGTTSHRKRDTNQLARSVIERTEELADERTEQLARRVEKIAADHPGKNPAAVALGRRGGLKGGRARMDGLTPVERKELALKAAKARWGAAKR